MIRNKVVIVQFLGWLRDRHYLPPWRTYRRMTPTQLCRYQFAALTGYYDPTMSDEDFERRVAEFMKIWASAGASASDAASSLGASWRQYNKGNS